MTEYLKRFTDRASDVPTQLRRRLALIRDLDEKAVQLQKEIEEHIKKTLGKASQPTKRQKVQQSEASATQQPYDLQSNIGRLNQLADEKVDIAKKIYDFIDAHVTQLDSDLAALDKEIEAERKALGLEDNETATGKLGSRHESKAAEKKGKRKGGVVVVEEVTVPPPPIPSESEPLYCFCQKPSHGDMVGCDNEESCPYEWYHYECVGLTEAPQGQWFCPICRGDMKDPRTSRLG